MPGPLIAGALVGGAAAMTAFVVVLGGAPSSTASSGTGLTLNTAAVPDQAYVPWLDQAGALCQAVSPPLLAAQIDQESQWNPDAVSPAGAEGISQFMPGTWPSYDEPPAVAGPDTPFVPADAIMAQGRYDCALASAVEPIATPTGDSITSLLLAAYNAGLNAVETAGGIPAIPQTQAYVAAILADIPTYAAQLSSPSGGSTFGQAVIAAAEQYIGTPYSWGGGDYSGPTLGIGTGASTVGFDCSGLTMYAVYQASSGSIALPHSSQVQATMGTEVDTGTGSQVLNDGLLQPGDLIAFYNLDDDDSYDHIGIYIGNGDMIDAPETGQYVQVDNLATTYWKGVTWQVRSFG
jgi:cell wall-associated NlpC family hydrolase